MSLRRRILALTVGMTALVLALLSVPVTYLVHQGAREVVANDVRATAQSVADYVSASDVDTAALRSYLAAVNDRDGEISVAVRLADGTLLGPSSTWQALPPRGPQDGDGDEGRRDADAPPRAELGTAGGPQTASAVVSTDEGPLRIGAVADGDAVADATRSRLALFAAAAAALLVLAVVLAETVSRRLVASLTATARAADRLSGGDMSTRAPGAGPAEVRAVADALNRLAVRIVELIRSERETVADLSHRLRTPLTAVRLDVEALPPGPRTQELADRVDELERTLDDVIRAARRPQREGVVARCDPVEVVTGRVAFWTPLAEDQGRLVTLHVDPGVPAVRCAADDLAAALDALLENVVAHTPDGGRVGVEVTHEEAAGVVRVVVVDDGPGLPPGALLRGRSDRGSTGLGLDIARRGAEATGGRLEHGRGADGRAFVALVLGPA